MELVVLKLGGAGLSVKDAFETFNIKGIEAIVELLIRLNEKVSVILVHGAGSFGHFQAKQFGLSNGTQDPSFSYLGLADTRRSVTKLTGILLEAFLKAQLPVVAVSPFQTWSTRNKQVVQHNIPFIQGLLDKGCIPLLHGDVVLDHELGCTILSGDTIMIELAKILEPSCVGFLSDVDGVYDRPPGTFGARLLPRISSSTDFQAANQAHDVTGGMAFKVQAARTIAQLVPSATVFISQASNPGVLELCSLLQRSSKLLTLIES